MAQEGDALCECDLGWCYFYGNGVTRDYNEAAKWFRRAVEHDSENKKQNNLGWCYYRGTGIEPNYSEQEQWFRREAEKGNADAQYFLGWLFIYRSRLFDPNVPKIFRWWQTSLDEKEAVRYWRESAEQGFAEAQYELGAAYFYGIGVEKNRDEGIEWQRKAAKQRLALSQRDLDLYLDDDYDPNHVEAIGWLREAAEQGQSGAQTRLASYYALGGWIDVVEGYKWALLAEKNGRSSSLALGLKEGCRVLSRKPMTAEQITQGEELACTFREDKSETTARAITTMYQAMTLCDEYNGPEFALTDLLFPDFW